MVLILNVCWSIFLLILSGLSKAVKDTIEHHYLISIFQKLNPFFWNPSLSWLNKYKNKDQKQGPAFWGSTTFLVWITDGWHLLDMIQALCWQFTLSFWICMSLALPWWYIPIFIICIKTFYDIAFHFPYTYWFVKK